jgi:hypothetical protein
MGESSSVPVRLASRKKEAVGCLFLVKKFHRA